MFCPKCGSQNADETKFCRGCGVDLSNVLAVVSHTIPSSQSLDHPSPSRRETAAPAEQSLAEKHIDLSSRGWRGLIVGFGFLIVAGLAMGISMRLAVLSVFLLTFAVVLIGTGISRFIQAKGLKRLLEPGARDDAPALSPGQPDYIEPLRSLFETDDLTATLGSVTEHTTTRLKIGRDADEHEDA